MKKVLEEIHHAENGAPCSNKHIKKVIFIISVNDVVDFGKLFKKLYFDSIKKALNGGSHHTSKQQLTVAACVSSVKLCKAATYINVTDSANVFFTLLHSIIDDVKV